MPYKIRIYHGKRQDFFFATTTKQQQQQLFGAALGTIAVVKLGFHFDVSHRVDVWACHECVRSQYFTGTAMLAVRQWWVVPIWGLTPF